MISSAISKTMNREPETNPAYVAAPAAWRYSPRSFRILLLMSKLWGRAPARLSSNRHTAVRLGVCLSIALVPSNFCAALRGANMMKARVLGVASFSLFFLLSVSAPVHSQEGANGAPSGAPPPLSAIAHDFTTWLNHAAGNGAKNHRAGRPSSPLPRTRPAPKPASERVASNNEWSEFVPSPGASKKKTPTLVQIRD